MPLVTKFYDLDGAPVLDASPATGYRRKDLAVGGWQWRVATVENMWVDGGFDTQWSLERVDIRLVLRATGTTWAAIEGLVEDLKPVVFQPFLFEASFDGVSRTWSCGVANMDASYDQYDRIIRRRIITLDWKAQPNPTVTGV